jgi:hypothetical protein
MFKQLILAGFGGQGVFQWGISWQMRVSWKTKK